MTKLVVTHNSKEYREIQKYYKSLPTISGVDPMEHIDEGIFFLEKMLASDNTLNAWCIHPIVQESLDIDVSWSDALPLAEEFAVKANAFLCLPETDYVNNPQQVANRLNNTFSSNVRAGQGTSQELSRECAQLLIADNIQLYYEFLFFDYTNDRGANLENYFSNWLRYLRQVLLGHEGSGPLKRQFRHREKKKNTI